MRAAVALSAVFIFPGSAVSGGPEITVEILNYFLVPDAWQVLGLDYDPAGDRLFFCSNLDDLAFICDADDGEILGTIDLTYDETPSPFGVCYDPGAGYVYINDWGEEYIWRGSGGSWTPVQDPYGKEGRGIDLDPAQGFLYETGYKSAFCRFRPGGEIEYFRTEVMSSRMSGLTYFPYYGADAIAFNIYESVDIYFYEVVGPGEAELIGTAQAPVSNVYYALGLSYAEGRGTFFWSCLDNFGTFWIYEFAITFEFEGVRPASLGKLKTLYR